MHLLYGYSVVFLQSAIVAHEVMEHPGCLARRRRRWQNLLLAAAAHGDKFEVKLKN